MEKGIILEFGKINSIEFDLNISDYDTEAEDQQEISEYMKIPSDEGQTSKGYFSFLDKKGDKHNITVEYNCIEGRGFISEPHYDVNVYYNGNLVNAIKDRKRYDHNNILYENDLFQLRTVESGRSRLILLRKDL